MRALTEKIYIKQMITFFFFDTFKKLIQFEVNKLRNEHTELINFLANQSVNATVQQQPSKSKDKAFLYLNNSTRTLEGISMQSTYSVLKLNPYKIFTLITTTSLPLTTTTTATVSIEAATTSLIPLYHQFIYTVKIFNYSGDQNLIDLLNEQSIESSKLRVHALRSIGNQLEIDPKSLRINWIEKTGTKSDSILISLSDINLLDMQNTYNGENLATANEIASSYEEKCLQYFDTLRVVHLNKLKASKFQFDFDLLTQQLKTNEKVQKVQFLKLCDLKQIYSILLMKKVESTENLLSKQLELANIYIKNSTEDLSFQKKKLTLNTMETSNVHFLVDDKNLSKESSATQLTEDVLVEEENKNFSSITTSSNNNNQSTLTGFKDLIEAWFWSIIPAEDLLLAVIVPITIIVSLIVFTIVTVCLLQMCNKDYKEKVKAKKLASLSNTTELTMSQSVSLEKSNAKTTSIFKERAYLSKGVPVILYEEMGDKPIDDYDENNRDIMDCGGDVPYRTMSSHYRSPLIMRNEKSPVPAPPEYSRPSLAYTINKETSPNVPNENQAILTSESSEESVSLIMNNKYENQSSTEFIRKETYFKPLNSISETSSFTELSDKR